jgi:hypothetical protein
VDDLAKITEAQNTVIIAQTDAIATAIKMAARVGPWARAAVIIAVIGIAWDIAKTILHLGTK